MELHNNEREVSTNVNNLKSFTIQASAKAFKILSDQLYSDKVMAVIRELSTNAYDAHIAVGKAKKPFDVFLPYVNGDNKFSIRDYGPGMNEEHIMTLYTSYFGSDKNESNDFVGALGLGSKSPFAYTNEFVVTSWNRGMKKSYVCMINSDGIPEISKLLEIECGKETGLLIQFNVNDNDKDSFIDKAKIVYKYFKTTPNTNIKSINEKISSVEKPIFEGQGWKLYKSNYGGSSVAIMGNIGYPIDKSRFSGPANSFILQNNFCVDFKIGELDITPSREHLSYDKITIENINKKMEEVYSKIQNKIQKEIRLQKNMFDAKIKMNLYDSIIYEFSYIRNKLLYKRKNINAFKPHIDYEYKPNFIEYEMGYNGCRRTSKNWNDYNHSNRINNSKHIAFVYNDLDTIRKGNNKARAFLNNNNEIKSVLVFHKGKLTDKKEKKIFNTLGNPTMIMASEIKLDYVTSKVANKTPNYVYHEYTINEYSSFKEEYKYTQKDIIDFPKDRECILFELNHNSIYFKKGENNVKAGSIRNPAASIYSFNSIKELGIFNNTRFFFVKKAHLNDKIVRDNMTPFYEFVSKKFNAFYEKNKKSIIDDVFISKAKDLVSNEGFSNISRNTDTISRLVKNMESVFFKNKEIYKSEADISNYNNIKEVYHFVKNIPIESEFNFENKLKKFKTLNKAYPMIKHVSRYDDHEAAHDIADYINMMDKKR